MRYQSVAWRCSRIFTLLKRECQFLKQFLFHLASPECLFGGKTVNVTHRMSGCECKRARSVSAIARNIKRSAQPVIRCGETGNPAACLSTFIGAAGINNQTESR